MVVIMTVLARAMTLLARVVGVLTVAMVAIVSCRAMRMARRIRRNDRCVITGVAVMGVVVVGAGMVVSHFVVSGAAHDVRCPYPRRRCRQHINTFIDAKLWQ
jgi:hypothetical protein